MSKAHREFISAERAEVLGELQLLPLIVGTDALAIELMRALGHGRIDQPPDRLAMLQNEGHVVRAHFQHGA